MSAKSVIMGIGLVGGVMLYQMKQINTQYDQEYVIGNESLMESTSYNILWYLRKCRMSMAMTGYPFYGSTESTQTH